MPYRRALTCMVIVLALCLGGCKLPGDDVKLAKAAVAACSLPASLVTEGTDPDVVVSVIVSAHPGDDENRVTTDEAVCLLQQFGASAEFVDDIRDGLGLTSDRHENLSNSWFVTVRMSVLSFMVY